MLFTVHLPLFFGLLTINSVQSFYPDSRNICSYQGRVPNCCPGWRNAIGKPCTIPVCGGNCGDRGYCIKPDKCMCSDGIMRYACDREYIDHMQNDQAIARCPDNCNGHGQCIKGHCVCDLGYGGKQCEDALQSACYTKLNRGLCDRPLQHQTIEGNFTTELTFEACCNSIGVAWGQPCQSCATSFCGRGFKQVNGACRDIDECAIPGVCLGGQCINLKGTFTCKCPTGRTYDKDRLECVITTKACELNRHRCSPGGKCINLPDGDYKCACNWRYELSPNRKSCIPKRTITFDICSLYQSSVCKNGICIPRGSSYECVCNEGFKQSVDRKACIHKVDMCAVHRGYLCQNGECISMGREYYCRCNPGYTPSYDRLSCVRVVPLKPQTIPDMYWSQFSRNNEPYIPVDEIVYSQAQHDGTETESYWEPQNAMEDRQPPCQRPEILARCAGGFCLNLGAGAYKCDCLSDYVAVDGGRACKRNRQTGYNIPWQNDANQNKPQVHSEDSLVLPYKRRRTGHIYLTRPLAPCSQSDIAAKCSGGFCLNLGGKAYRCECLPGFREAENGRACIPA